jgi:hypothetical protein
MKRFILFLMLISSFASCSKDNDESDPNQLKKDEQEEVFKAVTDNIVGKWALSEIYNDGSTYFDFYGKPKGWYKVDQISTIRERDTIEYKSDNTYVTPKIKGTYSIYKNSNYINESNVPLVFIKHNFNNQSTETGIKIFDGYLYYIKKLTINGTDYFEDDIYRYKKL